MVGRVEFCYLLGHIALSKTRIPAQLRAQTMRRCAERKHGKCAARLQCNGKIRKPAETTVEGIASLTIILVGLCHLHTSWSHQRRGSLS